jgi:hypothetical protein
MRRAACSVSARRTTGWPWPRQLTAQPCTKSRYWRPSLSRSQEPAPSTIVTAGRVVTFITCSTLSRMTLSSAGHRAVAAGGTANQ